MSSGSARWDTTDGQTKCTAIKFKGKVWHLWGGNMPRRHICCTETGNSQTAFLIINNTFRKEMIPENKRVTPCHCSLKLFVTWMEKRHGPRCHGSAEPSSTQVTIPSLHLSPLSSAPRHVSVYPAEQRCTHTDGERESTGWLSTDLTAHSNTRLCVK